MGILSEDRLEGKRLENQNHVISWVIELDSAFLSEPVTDWPNIPAFLKFKSFVLSLPIVNDACERLLKRTNDYKDSGGKKEEDFADNLQVVEKAIGRVPDRKSKVALVEAFARADPTDK